MQRIEVLRMIVCGLLALEPEAAGRLGSPAPSGEAEGPAGIEAADWTGIREAYEESRHAAFALESGFQALNPGQAWRTGFDGRGFTVRPDAGGWEWGLELERYGFAGEERAVREPLAVSAKGQRISYDWDGILEEWFVNDTRGLEHGYTVLERPVRDRSREPGPLTFILSVRGTLSPVVTADGRDVHFVGEGGDAVLTYAGLTVLDADGREIRAGFERVPDGLRLTIDERGARYPLTIDPVAQQAYIKPSNTAPGVHFGFSVAVSDDTAVVGSPWEGDSEASGAVYVFTRAGTTWTQQAYLKRPSGARAFRFGHSVSVSGDTIVVGAPQARVNEPGVAYVFVRAGTTWTWQASLVGSNAQFHDLFGHSVSLSGDTIVVGAPFEDSSATGVNGDESDNGASDAGATYVFVRSGITWSQQAYLKASNTGAQDGFGGSVSVSGDRVIVGAAEEDSDATGVNGDGSNDAAPASGAAYVFVRDGTTWSQDAYLKASNTMAGDRLGSSVSASGETVVAGAHGEDSTAPSSGAAYVFVSAGSWSQQAVLKASNAGNFDEFGSSVAIQGDRIVVGARNEASNATGVNGDGTDNSAPVAGAAYLFVRSGTAWNQELYLKASNSEQGDQFGYSVGVSGNTVLVGASNEDSQATGVNGDQSDNSFGDAGAAYAFETCPQASVAFRNDGLNPASYAANPVVIGGTFTATVDNNLASQLTSALIAFDTPFTFTLGGGQTLLCLDVGGSGETFTGAGLYPSSSASGVDSYSLLFADDPSTCGVVFYSQAIQFGIPPFVLSNAQDLTIGSF